MTPPSQDPLKYRELESLSPAPAAADYREPDDGWGLPAPLPDDAAGHQPKAQSPTQVPAETPAALPVVPGAVSPVDRPHRNPLPSARGASAAEFPGAGGQLALAVGTAKRQPLPCAADHQARVKASRAKPAVSNVLLAMVLVVGLGAAGCFALLAHNYPIAVFIALLSMVGAALTRLILQAGME